MPPKYCSICGADVVEGSTLCRAHAAQAAVLSSFVANERVEAETSDPKLREILDQALHETARWARHERTSPHHWPQIAVYPLAGKLNFRRFFSVSPKLDERYSLTHAFLSESFGKEGVMWPGIARCWSAWRPHFDSAEVTALTVDLRSHDGLVVIGCAKADGKLEQALRFEFSDGRFAPRND